MLCYTGLIRIQMLKEAPTPTSNPILSSILSKEVVNTYLITSPKIESFN